MSNRNLETYTPCQNCLWVIPEKNQKEGVETIEFTGVIKKK